MPRIRIATILSTTTELGVVALLLAACSNVPVEGGSLPTATGGVATNSNDTTSIAKGSGSQDSSQTNSDEGKGGSSQTSKSSSSKTGQGGTSENTDEGEGGSSDVGEGGSSQTSKGGSSQSSKGGSSQSSKGGASSSTKSAGGTSAAGGTKAVGGASSTKGGSTAVGGSTAKGGSTATGGSTAKGGSTATGGTSSSTTSTPSSTCTAEEEKFSFFLASQVALARESANPDGFGGNLGGLTGADEICQTIADKAVTCNRNKVVWHAFLSTSSANARDRIGKGPWYDRRGRLLAMNLTDLIQERPVGADAAIAKDLPNENGIPNWNPDGNGKVDNHEILTGTGTDGNVYTQTGFSMGGTATGCGPKGEETWNVDAATCWGWTTSQGKGCPRVGHSWPRDLSGNHWISVYNEGGCAPGGVLSEDPNNPMSGGLDGTRRVGSAGGYGGFYCFAVTGE